ncbi:MAG: nucleotidyltransferase [Candidatus Magasanikbacteria bacterium CG11_big_fil_rev_8_21_14_0_20_39_34]|uniref:Nucleotidyltransferase n=1 Tax=Candidatus Magasanikbacteria bacterium CG11_big_fil_rev_8_21_14_0_20_39_34 TaxID=1974653 RepID=A0A2H0N5Q7_9BACT|nr:MAG: nucleotidyltransferase [Candidatus Magasanikbacteria bacterium CG11_big_fil_rev_8_21_14_0_20_39_34]
MSWEDTFKSWGAAPGTTEQQKMENAENAVRKAINAETVLKNMDISIIPQGSYKSRTNVRQDSDVDICICLNSTFFPRYPIGKTKEDYGNIDGSINFDEYRNLVQRALQNYFGTEYVTPGNKAFDIHSNTSRVDADVVPAFAYRYYHGEGENDYQQPLGIAFLTNNEKKKIINWPHHTYDNGKEKQQRTGQRYKKVVRIIKKLRNKMQEESISESQDIASFLIESMVWNAPDSHFNRDTYTADVRAVLAYCFNETLPNGSHGKLGEVNDFKYLFGDHQPWSRERAHKFFSSAWDYLGFE